MKSLGLESIRGEPTGRQSLAQPWHLVGSPQMDSKKKVWFKHHTAIPFQLGCATHVIMRDVSDTYIFYKEGNLSSTPVKMVAHV